MLMALQGVQLTSKMAFVGFDYSDTLGAALRYKQIQGLVVQNPFRMGEFSVKTLVDHLQGRTVSKRVDTGATMVTPENLNTSAIQRLLNPPMPTS
jgi:ribose transport system substrate-binding protein